MRNIAIYAALFLSFGANASDLSKIEYSDILSLPDCNNLNEEILNGKVEYSCIDYNYIYENETEEYEKFSVNKTPDYINFNNKSTQFILNNKGGYFARLIVEHDWYDESTGDRYRHRNVTNSISVGNKTSIAVGRTVPYAEVTVQIRKLEGWRPILTDRIYPLQNKWFNSNSNINQMQWDVWGTVFNAPHRQVQPAGTYNYIETNYVVLYGNVLNSDWLDKGLAILTTSDIADLNTEDMSYINDRIKAWSIPKGWTVRFYEDPNFQGNFWTRQGGRGDEVELRDKISSIQILSK
ncbi:hypothetical protein [Aliivibrio logei]|uniref:hypothetical protein n=1 Tax=Aliivibrio logei TaxID=688 RepID=UPI0035C9022E